MKHPVCVVFDVDDTLFLERDYARSGFAAVGLWANRWLNPHFGELCQRFFDSGQRHSIFDNVLKEIGIEPVPELIASLIELYRTHIPAVELLPDAHDALNRLQALDVPLAVISDGPATSQSRKVDALGLTRFTNLIFLTGLRGVGFHKPHPWAFKEVAAVIRAEKYIYVGDNPGKDFIAPQNMGWLTARIRRPEGLHFDIENSEPRPHFQFADCSPLPELVAELKFSFAH